MRGQRGYYYVELLIAAIVVAACLAPALQAMRASAAAQSVGAGLEVERLAVESRMEQVLAQPLAKLDAAAAAAGSPTVPTSYSDASGTPNRVLVFLSRYDGDNADADGDPFTGTDAGLIWVRAQNEAGTLRLTTLTAR